MKMSYWQGKRAVITGGSSGLGRALAAALVDRGARVAIIGRGQGALDQAAAELGARGEVLPVAADVTNAAEFERAAAAISGKWGGVDFFCHSAGRSMRGEVLATSPESFRELWELNFLAAVRGAQLFGESLCQNRGHLVLIGSLASKVAPRYLGAYPASKFPLAALAQQLRLEIGPRGATGASWSVRVRSPARMQRRGMPPIRPGCRPPPKSRAAGPGSSAIDPIELAAKILDACERDQARTDRPRQGSATLCPDPALANARRLAAAEEACRT